MHVYSEVIPLCSMDILLSVFVLPGVCMCSHTTYSQVSVWRNLTNYGIGKSLYGFLTLKEVRFWKYSHAVSEEATDEQTLEC